MSFLGDTHTNFQLSVSPCRCATGRLVLGSQVKSKNLNHHLERQTRDQKVPGSSPGRSGRRIFFSRVNFLCWIVFQYPLHPCVTAVALKRSQSFCQKCRWQVTAKHINTIPTWLWMKWHCNLVHGWMVYTEFAPKRQHLAWHQPCNTQKSAISTPLLYTHSESHANVHSESAWEQRIALYKSYE